jgi:FkbH-like protein
MKLAEALKIVQQTAVDGAADFSVYLASGILPLHLDTFLAAHLQQRLPGLAIRIQTGLYGDLPGNLAQLEKSSCHAGAVVIEWADLDPRLGLRRLGGWGPGVLPDIQASIEQAANQLLGLLAAACQSRPLALCLPTIALPPISYQPIEQFGQYNLRLERTLSDFASRAGELPHVKIVSRQRLDAISPVTERLDVKSELSTGFPYRTAHAARVAELLAGLIHPSPPKKGLITDLDDTLWRGLLGENGVAGISWELDRRSHIHALYQQVLRALAESGVLLAVASKNDPKMAAEALAHRDLLLAKDCFFPVEVSWSPKSQSVGRILDAWNIDANAVVFVDDSPLELAEVKSIYPTIECLRFPVDDEQSAYELFETLRGLFAKQAIVEEDFIRAASLRGGQQFKEHVETELARPLEDFLAQIDGELSFNRVSATERQRAFELVNKTNQFNLNGRRLNDLEFQAALDRKGAISLLISYSDKFGPLGKIAVILGQVESPVLKVDTWVMSCRAFSRHIEYECLEYLFGNLDVSEIEFDFHATARNAPAREFLSQFMDMEQDGPFKLTKDIFMSKKPQLSHKIKEASYV